MSAQSKKIVVIGGGTGTTAVLNGLRPYQDLDISVIVSMTDDGGSNAVIRDEFGLLPLSDVRKSIIALADDSNDLLRQIFTYRFCKGKGLEGHTLGNLIMLGLSEITGSEVKSIQAVSKLFGVRGQVIPVTTEKSNLIALYDDGARVASEHLIDEPEIDSERKIVSLLLDPPVQANPEAILSIKSSDYIIVGPGDLYTTTLANIVVPGIAEAIKDSSGQLIFVSNLMTKRGQTHWMSASDLISEITQYAKRSPDKVILHSGGFDQEILNLYQVQKEHPIEDDLDKQSTFEIHRADLTSGRVQKSAGDNLKRSLIRHDAAKLGQLLYSLF